MTQPSNRLTREQWITLLKDYASSGLSTREYAALKNVGYSTLTKWAAIIGIPIRRNSRQASSQSQMPSNGASSAPKDHGGLNPQNNGGFSFIDVTNYTKDALAPSAPLTELGRVFEEPACPPLILPSCGVEIRMPNGVMFKIDQVPFHALWPQIRELVRTVAP